MTSLRDKNEMNAKRLVFTLCLAIPSAFPAVGSAQELLDGTAPREPLPKGAPDSALQAVYDSQRRFEHQMAEVKKELQLLSEERQKSNSRVRQGQKKFLAKLERKMTGVGIESFSLSSSMQAYWLNVISVLITIVSLVIALISVGAYNLLQRRLNQNVRKTVNQEKIKFRGDLRQQKKESYAHIWCMS